MFLGKMFAAAWQGANAGARLAAAAIATGAKVVGQIPVAMAHLENLADQGIEKGLEVGVKTALAATNAAAVTTSEWKTWMDVKSAQVLQTLHVPVDSKAIQKAGDERTHVLQYAFTGAQIAVDGAFSSINSQLKQANAERLQSAEDLRAKISAGGVIAGKVVVGVVKTVGKVVEGSLVATGAEMVIATRILPTLAFQEAKALFTIEKVGDPVATCPEAQAPDQQLKSTLANEQELITQAQGTGLGSIEQVKAVEAHVDAAQKLLMSQDVYNDYKKDQPEVVPGWHRVGPKELENMDLHMADFEPKDSEFRAALYESDARPPKYTLAFKGTSMTSVSDWVNNAEQGLAIPSKYYERAQELAQKVQTNTGGNFDVTGHSLGGGLASAAAAYTGAKGVTFNAAGLNPETVANADMDALQNRLTAYHVDGEVLTTLQDASELPRAVGSSVMLPAQDSDNMVDRHLLPALEKGLNQTSTEMDAKLQNMLIGVSH